MKSSQQWLLNRDQRDPGDSSEHETELFGALEDTFYGPGKKKGEKLHDYALRAQSNARELAKQGVRRRDQVQGPEHSSPQCHHDTGGQQLVFWRCEGDGQAQRRRVSAWSTMHTSRTQSLCHKQKKQGL